MKFRDKVVVITGGAQGMGENFGREFVARGASVGIIDVDTDRGIAAASALVERGGKAHFALADVADEAAVESAIGEIRRELGGVDILVNGAAKHLRYYNQPPTRLPRDDWRRLLEVNVVGIVNCTSACREAMLERGGGVVINISSIASMMLTGAYGVSKLAVRGLTVALAQELAVDNIRVCCIAPGLVDTPAALAHVDPALANDLVNVRQLIKRPGRVDDLLGALFYLCSDDASFVTGETIVVGGGFPLRV